MSRDDCHAAHVAINNPQHRRWTAQAGGRHAAALPGRAKKFTPCVMNINDPRITRLEEMVTAAQEEFDLAVMFYEVWKPAAFDAGLHHRMGHSYAGHAFLAIRLALRRETLLALTRLWDTNKQPVRMSAIAALLREPGLVEALAQDRADRTGFTDLSAVMTADMAGKAAKILDLVNKYSEGGSRNGVRENLLRLRHERLAHRQFASATEIAADGLDARIEEFFDDASKLIQLLMSLVNATAYDPQDTAKVYRWHADKFWAGAHSERVEGHHR